jgi:hypothetical protein
MRKIYRETLPSETGIVSLKFVLLVAILIGLVFLSVELSIAQTESEETHQAEVIAPETINETQSLPVIQYELPSATSVELCQIDLAFVADGSGSISSADFAQIKQFIRSFVGNVNIGAQGTQVTLVQFSSENTGRIEQTLTADLSTINVAIDNMAQLGDQTDIQEGIQLASSELRARGRTNTPRVIVVLTDGVHNQPGDPLAESAEFREAGGFVFTISVGSSIDRNQLIGISSQPYTRYLYGVSDVNSLAAILNSLSENVCNCPETQSANERITRVADGLCLRVVDDSIYIGIANLANSNVRLKLTHELANQSQGLFTKRTLKEHIQSDQDLTTLTCLPPFAFPFIPGIVCVRSPTEYYVAINGTAHAQQITNPDYSSSNSILAINGQLYREVGLGIPERPRASFFAFTGAASAIHRSYTTTPAPMPSFAIPIDANAPSNEYEQTRSYIAQTTSTAHFAVGYRASILDMTATPPLRGEIDDSAAFDELTAIGISSDGMTIYLAATKPDVGPVILANKLAELGATRAILLDGSSSTQFASFRENYSAFYLLNFPFVRPVLNGIAAYSLATNIVSSIVVADPSGTVVLAPNTAIGLDSSGLPVGTLLTQLPVILGSPGTIDTSTVFTLPLPGSSLLDSGVGYIIYAQNPSGQVIQPLQGYGLIANFDLIDFPAGTSPCMIHIYFWNGTQWVLEPTSRVDLHRKVIVVQPRQFGIWALFANPSLSCAYLPVVKRAPELVVPFAVSLSTNSPNRYELQRMESGNGLASGSLVYTDRNYRYDNVPPLVQGTTHIRTANNDSVRYNLRLVINANKSVQLYVAHTDQQNPKPSWLNAFQDTGENLTFRDRDGNRVVLSIFTAVFPAGDIILGANTSPNGDDRSMYTVALKEIQSINSTEANQSEK